MMRIIRHGILFLLTLMVLCVPGTSLADERPYLFFEQPEEAILYFVERVAAADFEGALRATHAESSAEVYDLEKALNNSGVLMPNMPMPFPSSEYASYATLNHWGQKEELKKQLYGMLLSLLVDPALCNSEPRLITDAGIRIDDQTVMAVPEFIAAMDPARLKDLEVRYIARWEAASERRELARTGIEKRGSIYGFSDERYFVVVYSFEGKLYSHTYTVARYPQGWQMEMLCVMMLGTSSTGMVEPADELAIPYWRSQSGITIVYEADE